MLRNLINSDLVTVTRDTSVPEIARLMEEKNVGSVLVMENDKPVGIVTDRDLAIRCIAKGHNAKDCDATEVMTASFHCMSVDDGLYECIQKMRDERVRRMPVVDSDGRAIGILSFGDIVAILGKELADLSANTVGEDAFSESSTRNTDESESKAA